MKIRVKIIISVLPLLIAALLVTGIISSFSARSGMTRLAMASIGFKSQELSKYIENQWNLLVSNNLSERKEYVEVAKKAALSYAYTIIRTRTELIFAVNSKAEITAATADVKMGIEEKSDLLTLVNNKKSGWVEISIGDIPRVGDAFYFKPFDWYVFVTEEKGPFYREVTEITNLSFIILAVSAGFSLIFLLIFSSYLTRPLTRIVNAMKDIITTNDLSRKVKVEYKDEIGELANTFNIMTGELQRAYEQIKGFAFKAVMAQKNEHKIRNIFQKFVPKDVIQSIFVNPESMLIGENRVVAILFSDIRSFTTISEGFMPDELVNSLNEYFGLMVDIIMHHNGIVDKYIGDAIMAFYGAPKKREDDAYQAVISGLEMQKQLKDFNRNQIANGKPEFRTGIGINYGVVTVGNIGSEKKMDYTIIGDMVNLGSRLEGLTKQYKQDIIFSESVYRKVEKELPCRLIDKVVVKGKTQGESIYTAKLKLNDREKKALEYHNAGMTVYYKRDFKKAAQYFSAVGKILPDDYISSSFIERCRKYVKTPPPPDWNGTEILTNK